MQIPCDYLERVYAGVLGKIIGVYLGRPFEGWTHFRILQELGEIWYYVHELRGVPLVVTDDDISGTFTFLRALPDYGNNLALTPAQIGQTWLNYLIEKRTVLWWGGMGNSTEHTAYLRLKHGIPAPQSGSIAMNSKVVAEQIGAQIFIDGWAIVSPGDPQQAADLARRAASVSHDGEAVYGAQVLAAMEAQAFVEPDIQRLLDVGVSMIPQDSVIYRLVDDLREWRVELPDWRDAFRQVQRNYGYDKYGGNCHIVPNHALIMLGLLYGEDDFQKSLMITNTCGWDTDCNSGNIGCLMGIKNGLAGIDAGPDWRGPVADQLYLPTADGGRCVTDAVTETLHIVNIGRALAGSPPLKLKNGARYHFELPGSVQAFRADAAPDSRGVVRLENVPGHSRLGARSLAVHYTGAAPGRVGRLSTPTFMPPEAMNMPGYSLFASPTLYSGQVVRAGISAADSNSQPVTVRLFLAYYGEQDGLKRLPGPENTLQSGEYVELSWLVQVPPGVPVAQVGLEILSPVAVSGSLYLDYLTWDGVPNAEFLPPSWDGEAWRKAWVNGVDHWDSWGESYRLIQDEGTGLLIHGCREWRDYLVEADVTPHMVAAAGLAARVQGMRRYYALLLDPAGRLRLVKALDGETTLAEKPFAWQYGQTLLLRLEVRGALLRAWVDGELAFETLDSSPLLEGAVALVCTEGRTATQKVSIRPISS